MQTYLIYLIYLCACILFICVIYFGLDHINKVIIFTPQKVNYIKYKNFCDTYKNKYIPCLFNSLDGLQLHGGLFNYNKFPSWNDKIFLYSHGNSGWIGGVSNGPIVKMLSNYGSVFVYDYRGYGCNDGYPSEIGIEYDIIGAWTYLVEIKKIPPNKIIIYGFSLGSAASCKLVSHLIKTNNEFPQYMILNSPFSSINDMAEHLSPNLSLFSTCDFNNLSNLKIIGNKLDICLFHSKDDEIVPYSHSQKLFKNTYCKFIEIGGTHGKPIYTPNAINHIKNITLQ